MQKVKFFILVIAILAVPTVVGQQSAPIRAGGLQPGQVKQVGFRLTRQGRITIKGAGALIPGRGSKKTEMRAEDGNLHYYGWILDGKTRKPVWHALDRYHQKGLSGTYNITDTVDLEPGNYELYYAAIHDTYFLFGHRHQGAIAMEAPQSGAVRDDLYIALSAQDDIIAPADAAKAIDELAASAIVSLIRTGNDAQRNAGFSLTKATDIHIYAIGEGVRRNGGIYDYAWINDITQDRRVWGMSARNADYAGGARKNIATEEVIRLQAGHYMVHYVSDDSHSFGAWNTLPPNDPSFWGVTLRVDPESAGNVTELRTVATIDPVLSMTRARDNSQLVGGITLAKTLKMRVLCVGEDSDHRGLVDHGWIADALTGEKVWSMAGRVTLHAGGDHKNRFVDETIRLEKGSYLVHYVSDGSHAYGRWNASQPCSGDKWGITLWTANPRDRGQISFFEPGTYQQSGLVAEIVKVANQSYQERPFVLRKSARLRIIAIGEGIPKGMADYGWIESDDTGRFVWEMKYGQTKPAGGAEKNRLAVDTIELPAGKYKLCYETDATHAFASWNQDPPSNAERYGITLIHDD